jgi:hypothetical protein
MTFLSWCLLNLLLVRMPELELERDLGATLPNLTQAWMEERPRHSWGGMGAGGGCPEEGWAQEAVSGWWRAGRALVVRQGEI